MCKIELQKDNSNLFQFTQTESIVCAIWADVLQLEEIISEDNFFELGGDSLMAMMVLFRVNDKLHVDLPPGSIYKSPTLRELSQLIDETLETQEEKEVSNQPQIVEEEIGAI